MVRKAMATPRRRTATRYYDVVLRGTFEARFVKVSATSPEAAKGKSFNELKTYANDACNGGNTITYDDKTSESKLYKPKFTVEVKLEAKDEKDVREKMKALGDKVFISEVYKERVY